MKKKNFIYNIFHTLVAREGQILIEMLVALFVGGAFILGATLGVVSIVRYSFETKGNQVAAGFGYDLLQEIGFATDAGWHNIYDLTKGTSTHYFINQRATSSIITAGNESMLDNNVRTGLVGHWKFDEDAGSIAYDSFSKGNDGILLNSPTRGPVASCAVGRCLQFTGSNSVRVGGNGVGLDGFTSMSIALWINPATVSGYQSLLEKNYSTGYELLLSENQIDSNAQIGATYYPHVATGGTVGAGVWSFVVWTYDGSSVTLYLNNQVVKTTTGLSGSISSSTNNIYMGERAGSSIPFTGSIDDVRIYNRALTANEVSSLYNSSVYTRYFSIQDISRDSNGYIVQSGGTNDPSTQKTTVTVSWEGGRQAQMFRYLFRKKTSIMWNKDWFGGGGFDGPVTEATSTFATSSNIAYITPLHTITLVSTSTSGWVESSTFDTQVVGGAAVNSVLWQGTQPSGTSVKFQFAGSNVSTGPWSYYGYDGSGTTYFSPASPNVSVGVENVNNYRYFRYKLFLNPSGNSSPTVTDAIINWSK